MAQKSDSIKDEVALKQAGLLQNFVYHLAYYKVLRAKYCKCFESEFWTYTIDAHLRQAALYWSMVFGADGSNHFHWKKLAEKLETHADFMKYLKNNGVDVTFFDKARNGVKEFRDKYVAHRDKDFSSPTPFFDDALKIASIYESWLFENFEISFTSMTLCQIKQKIEPMVLKLLNINEKNDGSALVEYNIDEDC